MNIPTLRSRRRSRGVSLIELLVAVTIGGLLIFGAAKVYVDSKSTYEINDSTARLQETARYALGVLEPDIRMSNYWGLVKGAGLVDAQTTVTAPAQCGTDFARSLLLNVEGRNNTYDLPSTCEPPTGADREVASADMIIIRRASISPSSGTTGRLRICSTRIAASVVTDSSGCTAGPAGQVNDLIVNAYYVSRDSTGRTDFPSLRRKALSGTAFADDEIMPGVEDMQIQFGVDTTGTGGSANRYVNPDALPASAQVVSVRIWLLVRAENIEVGFTDDRTYEYGDRAVANGTVADLNATGAATQAYQPNDRYRRLLVSRTIQIRNALGT